MTDNPIKAWIEERRAIHAGGRDVLLRSSYELERESGIEEGNDIDAIVDAHNMFPRALDALNAVLELHKPMPVYEVAEMCENEDEDHQDSRHWEADDGTLICEDLPTGDTNCRWCCDEDGDPIEGPCFNVKVIQQAIEGATNE
ncbi:hypothetical protein [Brevibacterium oceani]|uniref:hypothetical protein n=1 Tax=Brevibacterium oceani TaxID=358099 RepID=UPI0015E662BE|nr:hypothetical protein [Brevibacterium oceani]